MKAIAWRTLGNKKKGTEKGGELKGENDYLGVRGRTIKALPYQTDPNKSWKQHGLHLHAVRRPHKKLEKVSPSRGKKRRKEGNGKGW